MDFVSVDIILIKFDCHKIQVELTESTGLRTTPYLSKEPSHEYFLCAKKIIREPPYMEFRVI
jgi:hypothetical protein